MNKDRLKSCLSLFLTFFKIGLFTFGGGYAMIPLISSEAADKKGWISQDEITDIVAIAESTPGPIAVNSATFVGCKTAGALGGACATLGVVLPSFIIIALLGFILDKISAYKAVKYIFFGVRAGALALIVKAALGMYSKSVKPTLKEFFSSDNKQRTELFGLIFSHAAILASFALTAVFGVSSVYVLLLAAGAGMAASLIRGVKK